MVCGGEENLAPATLPEVFLQQEQLTSEKRHSSPLEDGDLDNIPILKEFADGSKLQWALAIRHAPPGWPTDDVVLVQGVDWMAEFISPGKQSLPIAIEDGTNSRIKETVIDRHFVLVRVTTNKVTLNEARDYGRPAVRAALGVLQRYFPALTAQAIFWEGAIRTMKDMKGMFMASGLDMSVSGVTASNIPSVGMPLASVQIASLPEYLRLALGWYSRGWLTDSRIERFVHHWLAVVVIVDRSYSKTQRRKVIQDDRIDQYVRGTMMFSSARADDMVRDLQASYDIRNEVVHEGRRIA